MKLLYRAEEASEVLGCGRTKIYELIARGELESVRIDSLRLIPAESLVAYVERLRAEADHDEPATSGAAPRLSALDGGRASQK